MRRLLQNESQGGYLFVNSASLFFKKIIKPKSAKEDFRRREFILNIILVGTILLVAVYNFFVFYFSFSLGDRYGGISPIYSICILLFFLTLFILSRRGHFIFSSYIFIAIFFFFSTQTIYRWGVELPEGLLAYALVVVISGVLISTRFALGVTIASSFFLILGTYLQANGFSHPGLYWKNEPVAMSDAIEDSLIFFIIYIVSWLSNREIEKSLKRARKSEHELRKERDLLEIRVRERTEELKKIQYERIKQLQKFSELGRISSGLFHDITNYLTALTLNLDMAEKKEIKNADGTKTYLEQAQKTSVKMEQFVSAVRKQLQNQETRTVFSLKTEINEALQVIDYKAKKNTVEIVFRCEEDVEIFGNPVKFNQVVTNIISNAIDAYVDVSAENSRKIEIDLEKKGNEVNLSIRDFGSGISSENIQKIFEPFFTTKDRKSGTGIGLYASNEIIKKDFHGKISVESREKEGSLFTINLPIGTDAV